MKLLPSLSFFVRVVLVGALAGSALMVYPAYAQAPGVTLDQRDFEKARQALNAGKLEEAARLLEGIPVKYPTSPLIPAAAVQLGQVYLRMLDYDKAEKTLRAAAALKNIPPDLKEQALSLLSQVQAARPAPDGPKSLKPGATPAPK
jgi:TolA-binding protein